MPPLIQYGLVLTIFARRSRPLLISPHIRALIAHRLRLTSFAALITAEITCYVHNYIIFYVSINTSLFLKTHFYLLFSPNNKNTVENYD